VNAFLHSAILTTGHSGSSWVCMVLNHPEGAGRAYHEPLTRILGPRLPALLHVPAEIPADFVQSLRPYLDWVERRRGATDVLCEVHTGYRRMWERLDPVLPETRVVLVRNPVQVVHSLAYSFVGRDPSEAERWQSAIESQSVASALEGLPDASDLERAFGALCQIWADQAEVANGRSPVAVYRLEDLVAQTSVLGEFVVRLTGRGISELEARQLQGQVLNRKARGDRSPATLYWNVWNERQRALFRRICGPALSVLGYELPAREQALPAAQADATEPRQRATRTMGAHSPIWVFQNPPDAAPVLVHGQGDVALSAAEFLGRERAVLLRSDDAPPNPSPPGYRVVTLAVARNLPLRGVYVADPDPPRTLLDRLRRDFPEAELAWMLPVGSPTLGPVEGRESLDAFGPVGLGRTLPGDWTVRWIAIDGDGVRIDLVGADHTCVQLDLEAPGSGTVPLVPIGGGGLSYRKTPVPLSRFTAALEQLAGVIRGALAGRSLQEGMRAWRLAARSRET
jgi:hypothetical protein